MKHSGDITLSKIGIESQPLLLIDNFLPNSDSLIQFALQQNDVYEDRGLYPGLRSPAPLNYCDVLMDLYGETILESFNLQENQISNKNARFSMVATPTEKLSLLQRIPHFDRPQSNELAMIHYLCGEEHGGTSFYRHRSTGYEYVDVTRAEHYKSTLQTELKHITPNKLRGYINGSNDLFEQFHSIDARFNRAAIYRCSSLHSGNIGEDYAFDLNPLSGRFTVTSFFGS